MLDLLQEALFHLEYQHQILKQLGVVSPFLEDKFKVFTFKVTRGIMDELQTTADKNKEKQLSGLFFIPQQPDKVRLIPANSSDKNTNHIHLNLGPRLELHNSKLKSLEQEIQCRPDMNMEGFEEETRVDDNFGVDDEDVAKEVTSEESNGNATLEPVENQNTDHLDTNEQYDAMTDYLDDLEDHDYADPSEEEDDVMLDRDDSMFDPEDIEEDEEEIKKTVVKHKKKCDVCGIQVINLKSHKAIHSSVKHNCKICQKSFSTKATLRAHAKLHGERRHECNICHKKFFRKSSLQLHAFTHGVEVQCELCGLTFSHAKRYEIHMITHTGEKEHKCEECGKEFYYRNYLTRHIKILHRNSVDYKCDVCAKLFKSKQSLTIHRYIHTGTKRFGCEICDKRFIHKIELQLHNRQHSTTTIVEQQRRRSQHSGRKLIPNIKTSL